MTETRTKTKQPKCETRYVVNRSSRHGKTPEAIAVHTTESGAGSIQGIWNEFNNPSSDASSHVIIDHDGTTIKCVPDTQKAWTILNLNPVTLNIEFVGRAKYDRAFWLRNREAQLKQGARFTAYWCHKFDIPVQRGTVGHDASIHAKGIITHKQLTDAGYGTHWDPGPGFPMDRFLEWVKWYYDNGWIV